MLSPADIRRYCERRYPAFLRAVVTGEAFFPLDVRFGRPSPSADWEKLRADIKALTEGDPGYRIEWGEVKTRRWGLQRFPVRVWIEDERAFLTFLRCGAEVERFRREVAYTRETCPQLEPWLAGHALKVIEHAEVWRELLVVCRYFLQNPRPGLYARELPIPVDTKFVERNQGILRELLDFLLPEGMKENLPQFERRFGLRIDESLIRARLLDHSLRETLKLHFDDFSTPLTQFAALGWSGLTVIVVENKKTFLTVPKTEGAIAIFGGGGAAELLSSVPWLVGSRFLYWGDIDVHGYHILSGLRETFPELRSFLMEWATWNRYQGLAGAGRPARYEGAEHLTQDERRVYEFVRENNLLLEQEKIPHAYVREQLARQTASLAGSL